MYRSKRMACNFLFVNMFHPKIDAGNNHQKINPDLSSRGSPIIVIKNSTKSTPQYG